MVGPPRGAGKAPGRGIALDAEAHRIALLDRRISRVVVRPGIENPGAGVRGALECSCGRNRVVARPLVRSGAQSKCILQHRKTERPPYTSKRIPCASAICPLQLMVLVWRLI